MSTGSHEPIDSPLVLVDDLAVDQTADLLERFSHWLDGPDTDATTRCARALSLGETDDPESISSWAYALAVHLSDLAERSQLQAVHPDQAHND